MRATSSKGKKKKKQYYYLTQTSSKLILHFFLLIALDRTFVVWQMKRQQAIKHMTFFYLTNYYFGKQITYSSCGSINSSTKNTRDVVSRGQRTVLQINHSPVKQMLGLYLQPWQCSASARGAIKASVQAGNRSHNPVTDFARKLQAQHTHREVIDPAHFRFTRLCRHQAG